MKSDRLKKVTVNLYEEDIKFFERRFGYGWSVELRRIMHREVRAYELRDSSECASVSQIEAIELLEDNS